METLVKALGPVIVAAFAIQQLLELAGTFFFKEVAPNDQSEAAKKVAKNKKLILGIVSLALGFVLAFGFGLRIMEPFGAKTVDWLDAVVTAILLSAGTEGSNSIMKVLEYYKNLLKKKEEGDDHDGNEDNGEGGTP
ncbi:MAG: hypothetical protein ACOYYU_02985 [Chloroflexota bacterium]